MAFGEIYRIMLSGSHYVMEYPTKGIKGCGPSPARKNGQILSHRPSSWDDLYYNYHRPTWTALKRAGFQKEDGWLSLLPYWRLNAPWTQTLTMLDGMLQAPWPGPELS